MRKRFYGALVLGSFLLAGGMMTSCSDYDDDIDGLNQRMDAVEATVAELQKKIEAGSVITGVNTVEDGVEITLSNGEKFNLKNGANGAASVVEIGDNGNWYIDGKDTGKPSRGEKGEQGEQGPAGDTSAVKYYEPRQDGFWYEITINADGTTKEEKKGSWMPEGTMTAVYNSENGQLLISNVEGMPAESVLVIETWGELKSLAVIPYVLDEKTKMPVVSFYNIIKDGKLLASTNAKAHFRLNPNNANINGWEWSIIDRKVITRADGDNINELLNIKDVTRGDGELIVTLESKKSLEDLKSYETAIFALNGMNTANGNNIASDYAAVTSEDITKYALVNETLPVEEAIKNPYPTKEPSIDAPTDANLVYNEKIDLDTLVQTWAQDASKGIAILDDAGIEALTYKFTKPESYIGTDKVTNQQKYVQLDGSVVSVIDQQTAAKGRTPIFKVEAMVNGTVIATGYIKLNITDKVAEDKADEVLTVACGTINYQGLDAIDKNTAIKTLDWTTVDAFYNKYGLSKEDFKLNYEQPTEADKKIEKGVQLTDNFWNNNTTATNAASIDIDPTEILNVVGQEGKTREASITFKSKNKKAYPNLVVKFTYSIEDKVTFPTLSDKYLVPGTENIVEVKGRVEGEEYKMISSIKEHFTGYLDGYKLQANHNNMYVEMPRMIPDDSDPFLMQHGAEIVDNGGTGWTILNQDIQLTEPVGNNPHDYYLNIHIVLANGEEQIQNYIVRFTSPFSVSVNPLTLKTLADADKQDLSKAIVIKGKDGKVIFEKGDINKTNAAAYKITSKDYFAIEYGLGEDKEHNPWSDFGDNLTVDANGQITWNNDGNELQKDLYAKSKVKVSAGTIAILDAEGSVKVLSSANSQK